MPPNRPYGPAFIVTLGMVAVGTAVFAVAFRSLLAGFYGSVFGAPNVVAAIAALPPWLRLSVPVMGGFAAGLVARLRPSQGVSNVMEAVVLGRVRLSMRTTLSRVAASWLAIASGMSIGREGPLIEFGGSLGAALGRARASLSHTRVLVAAGTAAGFAAAYNTPFAAVIFVFETIIGIAVPDAVLSVIVATVLGTAVTRAIVGSGPIYGQRAFESRSAGDLLLFAVLGALAAVAALGFKRMLALSERLFDRVELGQPLKATLGGLVVGILAVWVPEVAGNGYEPLNRLLDQGVAEPAVMALLAAKIVATSASVGSGVPGGIFTPTLLIGAGVGTALAPLAQVLMPSTGAAGSYALVGMAAATAANIHAPVTAAVLVFELSGDYAIVLPLLLATAVATALSRGIGGESIYEAELRRKGLSWQLTLEGRRIAPRSEDRASPESPSSGTSS